MRRDILLKHKIYLERCRSQGYDGASAMASKSKGALAVVKRQQPQVEFVHCRSHCINLAVVFACKNEVIRGFMADLTSVCFFFANCPKRQQYFEKFIDFYKKLFKVSKTNCTHTIGLSKRRWVERHKAYDNYFMLYKFFVSAFESIVDIKLYSDFYARLQPFTKYLRQTLATGKVQFIFFGSFLLLLTKFSFWKEDWALGYNS